ncbi:MAG: HAMP domain-containing protein [Candidatus Tectomicrobia bacterium]|uniref:histidine kinase n=1 Tax=Tectimicrobiota bacterium TaxID=2528274 RepID=A0A932CMU0_UNCTE|nr:HAMP domain-containing protein [Candidatus Tectomicrobia bacterium]
MPEVQDRGVRDLGSRSERCGDPLLPRTGRSRRVSVSLKFKLFLSMMLIGIFPLALAGAVGHWISSDRTTSEIKGRLEAFPEQIGQRINLFLHSRWVDLLLYRSLLTVWDSGNNARKTAFFREALALYPSFYSWMGVTDARGRIVAASSPEDVGKEMGSAEWFRETKSSRGIYLEDVSLSRLSGEVPVVGYSTAYNDIQGQFKGVIHAEVKLSALAQALKDVQVGKTGRALLVQSNGVVIAGGGGVDPGLLRRVSGLRAFQQALAGQRGILHERDEQGQDAFISFVPLGGFLQFPGFGWLLLVVQNTDEIYAPARKQGRALILIGLVVFLLILGESYFLLGRGIFRPISQLTEATRRLGAGDLPREIRVSAQGEIGELAASFNQMVRDLKAKEEAQERLQKQMVQAGKLAVIGQLMAGIAHEVGTPLNVVSGNAEYLLMDLPEGDPKAEELRVIIAETERIASLIRQLLDFSCPQRPQLKEIDLNRLLRGIFKLMEHQISKRQVRLEAHLQPDLPPIQGDPHQLQQVFLNLFVNACQAMPGGGTLTVSTRLSPEAQLLPENGGSLVETRFSDTGCGISQEHLSRIFEPFFTTKDPGKGIGLGLAICQGIIEDHGGTIGVESAVPQGSTFIVKLPVKVEEEVCRTISRSW